MDQNNKYKGIVSMIRMGASDCRHSIPYQNLQKGKQASITTSSALQIERVSKKRKRKKIIISNYAKCKNMFGFRNPSLYRGMKIFYP